MEMLIAKGANLRKTTGVGLMALHIAAGVGFRNAVELLIGAGSPISARCCRMFSVQSAGQSRTHSFPTLQTSQ